MPKGGRVSKMKLAPIWMPFAGEPWHAARGNRLTNLHETTPRDANPARETLFAALVLGAVFLSLAAMTWRKWPDLIIDFGVQLYTPWRLALGDVLYRDVPYLTGGPLAQYLDAAVFRVFGASVLTLVMVNLAILGGLLALVYRAFYRAADQLTALMAGLAILLAFGFEHYSDFGVFNYVTPYSEEIYQGLALAIACLVCLGEWARTGRRSMAAGAGLGAGLVFLTKAEVFLALAVALAAGLALGWRAGQKGAVLARGVILMGAAGALPILGFFAYFLGRGSARESLAWTCWAWTPLLTTHASDSPFYRWCLGLDDPWHYIQYALLEFLALALVLTLAAWVLRRWKEGNQGKIAASLLAAGLIIASLKLKWEECGLCLPLLVVTTLILLWRERARGGDSPQNTFMLIWTVFSLVLLAKLGFYSRIWHYGFALAMPAFLTAVYLLLWLLPNTLAPTGVPSHLFRAVICAFLATGLVELTLGSKYIYQKKTVPVASGADRLWTFPPDYQPTGAGVALAYSWLAAHAPENSTLAALPQGAMLNFLLRRDNPAKYLRWNPPELAAFGQSNMTRAFLEHPPDYVALLGLDNSEFGVRFLGDTPAFGQELMRWIDGHYQPVCFIGDDWTKNGKFGVKILKRISEAGAAGDR